MPTIKTWVEVEIEVEYDFDPGQREILYPNDRAQPESPPCIPCLDITLVKPIDTALTEDEVMQLHIENQEER